jgi:HEPN domain-containing protein
VEAKPIIDKDQLRQIGDTRLAEARALLEAGHFSGAIYLAGYAVECWLKVAICHALDWEGLYETFKSHDLKHLLLHSGLIRRVEQAAEVSASFKKITGMWPKDRGEWLRYNPPESYTAKQAEAFLNWVDGEKEGVIPWLSAQTS